MAAPEKRTITDLASVDPGLATAGWTVEASGEALLKTFRFGGFVEAMAFMGQAAWQAEAANHHPEWSNVYNRVAIRLTTHDSGGVTDLDLALAHHMEDIAAFVGGKG